MLKELGQITDPSLRERLDRGLVSNLIKAKVNLGLGLKKSSKKATKWTHQLAEELHKPVMKNLEREEFTLKVSIRFMPAIWSTCKLSQSIITA